MFAYCLADFFNLGLWPTGREPRFPDIRDGIEDLIRAMLAAAPDARDIKVRLYGGWHGEIPETRVHLREITEAVLRRIPMRAGSTRLVFEIADSPIWNPSLRLLRTVRDIRINHIAGTLSPHPDCSLGNGTSCSVSALQSWCKGKCPEPGCDVTLGSVLGGARQKMVDTLMTADAVAIGSSELADIVLLASDDDDLLPALFSLMSSSVRVIHMRRRPGPAEYYRGILERDKVHIHAW